MTCEPRWLTVDEVLELHRRTIDRHGGSHGLLDVGLLESALARPQFTFAYNPEQPGLPVLAAEYGFGLAKNHAFRDGNKRIAAIACMAFLQMNGHELGVAEPELERFFLELAAGERSLEELAVWIAENIEPI